MRYGEERISYLERLERFFGNCRYTTQELHELSGIWDGLDPNLKLCAEEPFDFGKWGVRKLRLNQVGMAQLIRHLDKYGFEIKKKQPFREGGLK